MSDKELEDTEIIIDIAEATYCTYTCTYVLPVIYENK